MSDYAALFGEQRVDIDIWEQSLFRLELANREMRQDTFENVWWEDVLHFVKRANVKCAYFKRFLTTRLNVSFDEIEKIVVENVF